MNQYQSESIDQLITALAKAQGEMSAASKDSKGYNYKYADLASVWGACRDPLSHNGLAVTQIETQNETGEVLVTILGHSSGQWMRSTMAIRVKPSGGKINELQERGSVLTYLRRYALSAIVGVAPAEDDDGNSASSYKAQAKPEPVVVPMHIVNASQLSTLLGLMAQCGNDYTTKIMEWLATKGVPSIDKMPVTLFEIVKTRINAHLAADEIVDAIV